MGSRADRAAAAATLVAISVALAAVLPSCAEAIEIGYQSNDAGSEGGPGLFTPPPASDAGDASLSVPESTANLCVAKECPWPWVSCIAADGTLPAYACETDVSSSILNCGGCGVQCDWGAPTLHLYPTCLNGACKVACADGYFDCNGITDDGCEAEIYNDPANCGACGNKCAPGVACIEGACGGAPGLTDCNGTCVDLANSDSDCGQCGYACEDHVPDAGAPPPNMHYGCQHGKCEDLKCNKSKGIDWTDCNDSIHPDGCEINLAQPDPQNCGACGNKCAASEKCFFRAETGMACQCRDGTTYCPGTSWPNFSSEKCADLENDPNNCGSCGYQCPFVSNAAPTCSYGRCGFKCNEGRADCNGSASDGCEVSVKNDPRNCGACGASCDVAGGQPCVDGQCATKDCEPGEAK